MAVSASRSADTPSANAASRLAALSSAFLLTACACFLASALALLALNMWQVIIALAKLSKSLLAIIMQSLVQSFSAM